jgi:hypothetical protein
MIEFLKAYITYIAYWIILLIILVPIAAIVFSFLGII